MKRRFILEEGGDSDYIFTEDELDKIIPIYKNVDSRKSYKKALSDYSNLKTKKEQEKIDKYNQNKIKKSLEFYKDNTVSLDDTEIKPFNYDFSNITYNSDSISNGLPNGERELKEQIYFNNLTKDFDEKTKRYENQYANKRKTYKDIVDIINNTPNARIQYNPGYFVKAGNRLFMLEKMRDLYGEGRNKLEDGGRKIFTKADKDRRAYYRDTEGYMERLAKLYPEVLDMEEYEYNEEESPREYYKRMIDELPENNTYEKIIDYAIKQDKNTEKYFINRGDTFRIKSNNKNVNSLIIDKNFADSLMYNAGKYNSNRQDTIPLNVVVGIPFRESTFGSINSYKTLRSDQINPITAMSNWNHKDKLIDLTQNLKGETNSSLSRKKALSLLRRARSFASQNPYFSTWNYYKKGMYNTGHKKQFGIKYEDAVEKEGNDILNSNEFKKYMNEQGWKQYMKGKKGK